MKTVLVVDDNADVRRYVRSVLTPTYTVVEAADAEGGLREAREEVPTCILVDAAMMSTDGITMVQHLKSDRATSHIPVVALTAQAETEHEVERLRAGADDYVTKPFAPDVLHARVAGMIEVHQRVSHGIREAPCRRNGDESAVAPSETARRDDVGSGGEAGGSAPPTSDSDSDAAPQQLLGTAVPDDEPVFVQKVRAVIEERLADPDLSVEQLASAVAVSRSTLYRRLKEQADATPSQFVQQVRIEHGARLLREEEGTVSEVAYAVGFNSLSYFSRQFREHLGQSPSEYVEIQE